MKAVFHWTSWARVLLLGAAGLLSSSLAATLGPQLSLPQQAKKAQVIVRAAIGSPQAVTEGEVIYSVYPLDIKETVAGELANLPTKDGKPALYILQGLQGMPSLSGQEAFLLLYTGKMDSPIVGVSQGFYPLSGGKFTTPVSGMPSDPDAWREAVRSARSAQ